MSSSAKKSCRWGFLGTAGIARKNWLSVWNAGNGCISAVASREPAKARAFINDCQARAAFDSSPVACTYDELLKRDDVDAVYIPLPTGLRKEWVIRAAQAGKHVMCEKPCAANLADLQEMTTACERANVQFMDGVMFMHSQRMQLLRETLNDGSSVGPVKRIASQFSFRAPDDFLKGNIRVSSELEPQGCLGDLGWYTIRFSLWVMNYQTPRAVSGRILSSHGRSDSPNPVPMDFSGELFFDGVSAAFYNSFLVEHQQWASISGERGHIHVPDFVLPSYGCEVEFQIENSAFQASGCDFHMERHSRRAAVREYSQSHPTAQESVMFRTFGSLALSGQPDPHWPRISLLTQRVMDACLQSAREERLVELT